VAVERTPNGSGGSMSDKQAVAELRQLEGTPMADQLSASGFRPVPGASDLLKLEIGKEGALVAMVQEGRLVGVFGTSREQRRLGKFVTPDAIPVSYSEERDEYTRRVSSVVTFRTELLSFEVSAEYGGMVKRVRLLKDLKDVELSRLGFELPVGTRDARSGFAVGAANEDETLRSLESINGVAIAKIEAAVRKQPACSSKGPLLGADESLIDALLAANAKARSIGLSHQELARPLLIVLAVYQSGLGQEFTLHGTLYKIHARARRSISRSCTAGTRTAMGSTEGRTRSRT
jgi:hypothetical protein